METKALSDMGVIYYATNPETKQAYELGKGGWGSLCPGKWGHIPTDGDLKARVLEELTSPWFDLKPEDADEYADEIATALKALGPSLVMENDAGDWRWDHLDNQETRDFAVVGTRYK